MKSEKEVFALTDRLRQIGYELHGYLRHGHLEKVYENGMAHRGRKAGIEIEQQHQLKVFDEDGMVLGQDIADLFAVKRLSDEHTAQLPGYMRACRIEHGLIMNFGAPRFEFRQYILSDV